MNPSTKNRAKPTFGAELDNGSSTPAEADGANFLESELGFQGLGKRCDLVLSSAPVVFADEGVEIERLIAFIIGIHTLRGNNISAEAGLDGLLSVRDLSGQSAKQPPQDARKGPHDCLVLGKRSKLTNRGDRP